MLIIHFYYLFPSKTYRLRKMQPAGPVLNLMKVVIVGDKGVGKRTYVHKLAKKQHNHLIPPPQGGQLPEQQTPINFHLESTNGPCQITLVTLQIDFDEYEKQQLYYNQINEKLRQFDAALLMFSLTDRQSYKSTPQYFKIWSTATDYIKPMVMLSTKLDDSPNIKIKQKMITFHRKKNLQFYNICSKTSYNLLRPFEFLFKKKLSTILFTFVNPEHFVDFTSQIEFKQKQELEKQIEEMQQQCYFPPMEDDDD